MNEDDATQDEAPDMPPPERPHTVAGMLEGLETSMDELNRFVAGYNTLSRVYQTLTNQLPPGARPKGLMLTFKGSADDRHAVDVNIDIQKHVDPQYASHVIAPLANGQAMGMLHAVNSLLQGAEELKEFIGQVLGISNPSPPQPAPQRAA